MQVNNYTNNLIGIKFARAEQPRFEEKRNKGYVEFGLRNDYPDYLLSLYNESPKHGAIIKGKTHYIYGQGFENIPLKANSTGESWNTILKKCIVDDELFGGYYLQVIYNLMGKIKDVFHLEYYKVRTNKNSSIFYVKNDWCDNKEEARKYPLFDNTYRPENPSVIIFVKQYNPKSNVYPLPSYFQGLNYIESDVQVSRHILGNAKDGFVATTLINLNGGEPQEEQKQAVERDIKKKFTGSEGDRIVLMFNRSKENAADIQPLSSTMLTKEDFTNINNLISQEVFACHQITSPILFGIKSEGQLGGRSEIREAYEIFNNVYVNERQQAHEEIFNTLFSFVGINGYYEIIPVEPIKFEFSENIISQNLTKDEIRDIMGKAPISEKTQASIIGEHISALLPQVASKVLENMTRDEIRSLAGLVAPVSDINIQPTIQPEIAPLNAANENIKNLSGRQHQNVMRIVRQFSAGKLTQAQASVMLKNGFGFTDADINIFLGLEQSNFSTQDDLDFSIIAEFEKFGETKDEYEIISRKNLTEEGFFADAIELTELESNVLNLISKDKRIEPQTIADTLKEDVNLILEIISSLVLLKVLNVKTSKIGNDTIIERTKSDITIKNYNPTTKEILLRYEYSWRIDITPNELASGFQASRPFCQKMMSLNKIYSRTDIENISNRLGYSVWDRVGGWWTREDGSHSEQCRHTWNAITVIKK